VRVPAASELHKEEGLNRMLTEKEISLRWRELFRSAAIDDSIYAKAWELIEAIPATSRLRRRYADELSDLRRLQLRTDSSNTKPARRQPVK
jgi:hypothetical protein